MCSLAIKISDYIKMEKSYKHVFFKNTKSVIINSNIAFDISIYIT